MSIGTKAIPSPSAPTGVLSLDNAAAGMTILPIERLRYMSPKAWTDFVQEWVDSLRSQYARVERCDGAGDMGRDVVAFESPVNNDPWDNYQCKHYDHPLLPTDVWEELGKLAYYTYTGEYSLPRRYIFVAPQGAGNTLSKLFRSPEDLRDELFAVWEKRCRKKITSTKEVILDAALKNHIKLIDFTIFSAVSPLTVIAEHRKTPWHVGRFGGSLPPRAETPPPPKTIAASETNYVQALLEAYEDRLGTSLGCIEISRTPI